MSLEKRMLREMEAIQTATLSLKVKNIIKILLLISKL